MSRGDIQAAVSVLAAGRLAAADLERHCEQLGDQAGSAPPVRPVTTPILQKLAHAADQPTQFVRKYSECAGQQIPVLSGMVHLLAEMVDQPALVQALSAHPSASSQAPLVDTNSPDLRALRERLLKQVVLSNAAAGHVARTKPNQKKTIFADRTYLTNNYILDTSGQNKENVANLKGVPVSSQESTLVGELLYCLVGCGSSHIQPLASQSGGIRFKLDDNIDHSLQCLINRILPLCENYSRVVSWCEGEEVVGRTNQALVASIELLLHDYRVLICQLEGEWKAGDLTMHKLWFQLQGSIHTMELMAGLVGDISSRQATGGATLSILHDRLAHCGGNIKSEKILQFIVEQAAKPFFETLSAWLFRGVIIDPTKDFFVEDHEVLDKDSLPLEYNDDYWEKRYCLRLDKIPGFLHKYADTILRTGKYLNVIQQCDKSAQWAALQPLQYLTNPEHYLPIIDKAHSFASALLLNLLVKDRDLIGHLRSMKKYFLMEQGDFLVQFLDLCEKELSQPVDQVEPARLDSLLELALRTSSANYDQYKDNLCVALLPYDLMFQMGKILAIDTAEEQEFQSCDTSLLSGMDAFAFGYQVEWPVSLVLNHKALAQYQMLFRHLFYCKHIERLLSAVWITNKSTKFLPGDAFKVYHPSFGLRQKMLNLIQNLSYYMMVEVVEPAWHSLLGSLATCTTVDDVLAKHGDFLNSCLHDCLLSSPQLLGTVKKLLGVFADFAEYMQNLRHSGTDDFTEDVARYELQFSSVLFSLLDRISQLGRDNYNEKVLNILHRLDFNGFYTTAIDQFKSAPTTRLT